LEFFRIRAARRDFLSFFFFLWWSDEREGHDVCVFEKFRRWLLRVLLIACQISTSSSSIIQGNLSAPA
jgi:hypothetical protein